MSEAIHETLRRLFDIVVREAERNPRLARELSKVVAGPFDVGARSSKPDRKIFDATQFHAVTFSGCTANLLCAVNWSR